MDYLFDIAKNRIGITIAQMENPVLRKGLPSDLDELLPLVTAYHEFESIGSSAGDLRRSVAQLLDDPSLGTVWRIQKSEELIGYIAVCFGYSIEFGGRDAFIDEFYVVPHERGRGVGGQALKQVIANATSNGIVALHLEVNRHNETAHRIYGRRGFRSRSKFHLMSLRLSNPAEKRPTEKGV